MMDKSFFKEIEAFAGQGALLTEELLSSHTTFRVGGKADAFLSVQNEEQIKHAIKVCEKYQVPFFVLGNGSNLLVSDDGYRGLVIAIGNDMAEVTIEGNSVTAQAGALLGSVSQAAAKSGLSGMEFASGIPGTIGGGIVMNAGAYGGEICQVCRSVEVMDMDGKISTMGCSCMEFSYRHSILEENAGIVLSAIFELEPKPQEKIREKMADLMNRRKTSQPLDLPSAGSAFKRPVGAYAAALIDQAGLKGFCVGGAGVSKKHAGFVVNNGGATAADVKEVLRQVADIVFEKFGFHLEPEVRIW